MRLLSKSNFNHYLQCTKYLWLEKFRPELKEATDEQTQHVFDVGNQVDGLAQALFKGGVSAYDSDNFESERLTRDLIKKGHKTIYQPTTLAKAKPGDAVPRLLARADIIKYNTVARAWDIYEVKSGNSYDKDIHCPDVTFQKLVFEGAGYKINKTFLVHLNGEYVKDGPLDVKKLFMKEDISSDVKEAEKEEKADILKAIAILDQKDEVQVKILSQCGKPYECPFKPYCWKAIPEHSIYDLTQNDSLLEKLLDMGIMKIKDISDDFRLPRAKELQVIAEKTQKPHIEKENLADSLKTLEYPLYFLDYETTYMVAIPIWDGTSPYQQVPFQYSLHIQRTPNGKLEHYEFLAKGKDNPVPELLAHLKQDIDTEKGTVIVWNKTFEMGKNKEMSIISPKHKKFLESVNNRVFDLMVPFKKRYYVHPGFEGSCSIKHVLPTLAPDLSYKNLKITQGGEASLSWQQMNFGGLKDSEQKKIYEDLLKYCEMDTYAMVRILEVVRKIG